MELRSAVLVRTDRIGDVLLALPAFAAFARAFPACKCSAVVSPRTRELVEGQPFIRDVYTWDPKTSATPLTKWLRDRVFDAGILFYPRALLAWALLRAGIPIRVGTAYRWYSRLLNRRVAVHRRSGERHEVEYNFDLLAPFKVPMGEPVLVPPVISVEAREDAQNLLARANLPGPYAVVHPKGGGSAVNATAAHWGRIAAIVERNGVPVVVTGAMDDAGMGAEVLRAAGMSSHRFVSPARLSTLASILSGAQVVVGPSTGPLHLAAAMGRPTVGLYSVVKSQSPVRWRPWSRKGVVLQPEGVTCRACLRGTCRRHHPLDTITPEQVLEAIRDVTNR